MDYALAKELKDAGFHQPLRFNIEHSEYTEKNQVKFKGVYATYTDDDGKKEHVYVPTLSELIDACIGEYWFTLVELKPHAWRAEGRTLDLKQLRGEGKTPEEAVARLCLELNKKKNLAPKL